jgi:hypothetical protein
VLISDDEGLTWADGGVVIAGGVKPFGTVNGFDGTEIVAAFVPATEKIAAVRRQVGELAYGTQFNFRDASADLLFENDTFSLAWGFESPNRLLLVCHIKGETQIATFWSADAGNTFTRI